MKDVDWGTVFFCLFMMVAVHSCVECHKVDVKNRGPISQCATACGGDGVAKATAEICECK